MAETKSSIFSYIVKLEESEFVDVEFCIITLRKGQYPYTNSRGGLYVRLPTDRPGGPSLVAYQLPA